MQVRVLLFAGVRDAADADFINVELDDAATAGDILDVVADRLSAVAELVKVSRLAVDGQYVGRDHPIESTEVELALIPPVSGG